MLHADSLPPPPGSLTAGVRRQSGDGGTSGLHGVERGGAGGGGGGGGGEKKNGVFNQETVP
eukprot:3442625-Rhodomonas_salina.1